MIKRKRIKIDVEELLLTAMIVSDDFHLYINSVLDNNLIENEYVRIVVNWCSDYYSTYKKAPQKHIQDIYNVKKTKMNEVEAELIATFLSKISNEFERTDKFNFEYALDRTKEYLHKQSLKYLADELSVCVNENDLAGAETVLSEYKKVSLSNDTSIDPFTDIDAIKRSFEQTAEPLFKYPGALGRMLNSELTRDCLLGLMAPEKRGKTWFLIDIAMTAARHRCNVAFFEVGDMSESQILKRKHIYLARKSDRQKYCGEITIPELDCAHNQDDSCKHKIRRCHVGLENSEYIPCIECSLRNIPDFDAVINYNKGFIESPLNIQDAIKNGKVMHRRMKGRKFKLSTHANRSINVTQIEAQLDLWEQRDGFIADVVIIDYADILAPEDERLEHRHRQNETWQALRALSQRKHCLVVTATQTDSKSYDKKNLGMSNFSEDKRKYSHVNGMLALNQTSDEKKEGIMRLSWILLREGEYDERFNVNILQCLSIGRPFLASYC